MCFGLHGDLTVTQGQIAHLNGDRSDSSVENLAFMCLPHHDWFDSKPSQSKGGNPEEAKHYRKELYAALRKAASAEGDVIPAAPPRFRADVHPDRCTRQKAAPAVDHPGTPADVA